MSVSLWSMTWLPVNRQENIRESLCFSGLVNVTVNCCIWNELMFKKESLISANAYRCEVLVCEEKVFERHFLFAAKISFREMVLVSR